MPSLEGHPHSDGPDAGRNSGGRGIIEKKKDAMLPNGHSWTFLERGGHTTRKKH